MFLIDVRSEEREQLLEITDEVRRKLKESDLREGVCVFCATHDRSFDR